ncbi:DNA-binding transcriptional LysR family regulator [Paraburkholderia silvatlantica]|uniref:DNA-binding transcriptional LysR family regulator n=1 Tax=Paraburkholderia silvatlantica TaxID=321895 RepID=A0A2V4TKT7_9BURK|nr:LysR family transcriptional regulator [Paraburkholderia silvatlantica]PYE15696.1 DNA-binding transcriptional LysR family regulator [Paraburkholderia silvatlantica]
MKKQPLIETQALRVFLTMAEERNMSTAASRLGISQSAVSQTIRSLENQLGAILVNRTARPMTLTAAGNVLASQGAILLDSLVDLTNAVADSAQGVKPSIRLGFVDSFAATCGSKVARALTARTTKLAVCTGLSLALEQKLLRRELDLVVSSRSMEENDTIVRLELLCEDFIATIPNEHFNGQSTVESLVLLSKHLPLIRFDLQSHMGMQVEEVVRSTPIKSPPLYEFDTADTLTSMVASGLGWAITTPLCALQAERFSDRVKFVPVADLVGQRSVSLLYRAEQHPSFVSEVFSACQEILKNDVLPSITELNPALVQSIIFPA